MRERANACKIHVFNSFLWNVLSSLQPNHHPVLSSSSSSAPSFMALRINFFYPVTTWWPEYQVTATDWKLLPDTYEVLAFISNYLFFALLCFIQACPFGLLWIRIIHVLYPESRFFLKRSQCFSSTCSITRSATVTETGEPIAVLCTYL